MAPTVADVTTALDERFPPASAQEWDRAGRLGLTGLRPLSPSHRAGRIGSLPAPMSLQEFCEYAYVALPSTTAGVRAAGDPDRRIGTVAVRVGAGAACLADAAVVSDVDTDPWTVHCKQKEPR